MVIENLPTSQSRLDLDTLADNVFHDVQHISPSTKMFQIFDVIKELNEEQDLVLFSNGTVSITVKGINAWN